MSRPIRSKLQKLPQTRARLVAAAVIGCYAITPAWAQKTITATDLQTTRIGNFTAVDVANGVEVQNLANKTMATAASFHVLAGQTFNIKQGVNDAFMVKVTGIDRDGAKILQQSVIEGKITSLGQFWLQNAAGSIIKPGAVIDVGRFVATLGITDGNYLAGKLTFESPDGGGKIVNQGTINTSSGGSVYLVGTEVSNEGVIRTPQGETILAAGERVEIVDTGTPGVKVQITGKAGNVTNLGQILADAGRMGMVGAVVRNSGTLNASSGIDTLNVVSEGGRVFLKASRDTYVDGEGRIVVTGTKGGRVEVLGNNVTVTDKATIDASGTHGGGTILVGGDYQGKNPDVSNAWTTYFGRQATLKADAVASGNGGKVIVWADDTTRAYGNVYARGGSLSGNGGFVEISGHRSLDFDARVNALAPKGKIGTLLLDPGSLFITDATWASTYQGLGASLILQTDSSGSGDIMFSGSGANNTFGHDLTVLAYGGGTSTGNISFENFKLNVTGNVIMAAGWDGVSTGAPAVIQGKGSIWIGQGGGTDYFTNIYYPYLPGEVIAGGNITLKAGKDVGIDYIQAGGNVSVSAGQAIWDSNWQTWGKTNISAYGSVVLTSLQGWNWSQCYYHDCSAISVDIGGAPTTVTATVASGSAYGGMDVTILGNAPNVTLHDYSTLPTHNWVEFHASGNVNTSGSSFYGSSVYLSAGNDLTYSGGISSPGSLYELGLFAGRNLTINSATPTTLDFTALFAGSSLTINSNVNSNGFVAFGSGTVEEKDSIESPSQLGDIPIYTGGTVTISNATVSGAGGVGFLTGSLTMTGSGAAISSGGGIYGALTKDLRLNNGATISSASSVSLAFLGADSTIYLNDASTYANISTIESAVPQTINVKFMTRSSGGIVIDGTSTSTTVAGSSGFYVAGTPAAPGAGLNLIYSGSTGTVQSDIVSTVVNSTNTVPDTNTTTESVNVVTTTVTTTGGTNLALTGSATTGGGEGQFGSPTTTDTSAGTTAASSDSSTTATGNDGTTSGEQSSGTQESKDEKKEDKDGRSEKGDATEKKDDKSKSKPVGKCSA